MTTKARVQPLPPYPSSQSRKALTASQATQLNKDIAAALAQTLALPSAELNLPAALTFVAAYARDRALQKSLAFWDERDRLITESNDEKLIFKRAFLLAEALAASSSSLDATMLLNLTIVYAPVYEQRTKNLFVSAIKSSPSIVSSMELTVVPSFISALSPSPTSGLHSQHGAVNCVAFFLHAAPPEILRAFTLHKDFIMTLASAYDEQLSAIARTYGGFRTEDNREIDEWESTWLTTKVNLLSTFKTILDQMIEDLLAVSDANFVAAADFFFDVILSVLDLPSPSRSGESRVPPTPFLNRSILADCQYTFRIAPRLVSALSRTSEKDPRLDILEAAFQTFDSEVPSGDKPVPGVLKQFLEELHAFAEGSVDKGKARDTSDWFIDPENDHELDIKVTKVLDILPDYPTTYIRALLTHSAAPYEGSAERVVEALLEGTAPAPDEISGERAEFVYTKDRRNVFDDVDLDVSRLHVGKKTQVSDIFSLRVESESEFFSMDRQDPNIVLRDRSFIDEMKADILRRAEAMSDEDEENENPAGVDFAYDEELEASGLGGVKVAGDGDDESGWEDDGDGGDEDKGGGGGGGPPQRPNPETILELAYIRDPKLFERDAQTRRGKPRTELKSQTGRSTFIRTLGALLKSSFSKVGLMNKLKGGESCWNVM